MEGARAIKVWTIIVIVVFVSAVNGVPTPTPTTAKKSRSVACYKTIFQFGDSLSDTGNAAISFPDKYGASIRPGANSSYGRTFFGKPSGRLSDGRLLIDYLAQSMKIPLLEPFLRRARRANFSQGVDFSVAEATASNVSFLTENGINSSHSLSLHLQHAWYRNFSAVVRSASLLPGSFVSERLPSRKAMKKGLYVIGEIGQNDYYYALHSGKTIEQVNLTIVPNVIRSILDLIEGLQSEGARNFLVIGSPPAGCSPLFLREFNGSSKDSHGCLTDYNTIFHHHRTLLKRELQIVRFLYPKTHIIFADFFDEYVSVLSAHEKYGFNNTLSPCSRGGGSIQGVSETCNSAAHYIYWDEINFTDSFNNLTASKFTSGQYMSPTVQLHCKH